MDSELNASDYAQHVKDLVLYVLETEVNVDRDEPVDDEWLLANVGEQRAHHPLHEAQSGWLDFFDGDWAFDTQYDGRAYFWFSRKTDAAKFLVMFGGRASISDPDRNPYIRLYQTLNAPP